MRADASSDASGRSASTRFTTIADTRRSASASAPTNSRACAIRLDSAVVTMTIAVSGARSLSWARAARAEKPSYIPSKLRTKDCTSLSRFSPVTRSNAASTVRAAISTIRNWLRNSPDGARVEQFEQAPRRVEEVDRLGRGRSVEHNQVGGGIRRQLEQFFHRHVI